MDQEIIKVLQSLLDGLEQGVQNHGSKHHTTEYPYQTDYGDFVHAIHHTCFLDCRNHVMYVCRLIRRFLLRMSELPPKIKDKWDNKGINFVVTGCSLTHLQQGYKDSLYAVKCCSEFTTTETSGIVALLNELISYESQMESWVLSKIPSKFALGFVDRDCYHSPLWQIITKMEQPIIRKKTFYML